MKKYLQSGLFALMIFAQSACSDEKDNLTSAIEDSWDSVQSDIDKSAEESLKDFADNPETLYEGDCETEYIPLGDIFTLRIPINRTGMAAIGMLFGSDAYEFLSLVDNAERNSKSKSDIKKLIQKHFNPSWAGMMTALIILDGEFDYDFETDDWLDASYDFDSKALYMMLDEKDYFKGGYGADLPFDGNSSESCGNGSESIMSGHKNINGNAIASNGKEYPFRVEFDISDGVISNAKYVNPAYRTTVNLSYASIVEGEYLFQGKNGKDDLTLSFSMQPPYTGKLTQGNITLNVKMNL